MKKRRYIGMLLLALFVFTGCMNRVSKKELQEKTWVATLAEKGIKVEVTYTFSKNNVNVKPQLKEIADQYKDDRFGDFTEQFAKEMMRSLQFTTPYTLEKSILTLEKSKSTNEMTKGIEGSFKVSHNEKNKEQIELIPVGKDGKAEKNAKALLLKPMK